MDSERMMRLAVKHSAKYSGECKCKTINDLLDSSVTMLDFTCQSIIKIVGWEVGVKILNVVIEHTEKLKDKSTTASFETVVQAEVASLDRLSGIDLPTASDNLSNALYQLGIFFDELSKAGKISGDGEKHKQALSDYARNILKDNWMQG